MVKQTIALCAAVVGMASGAVYADTCETYPGSQVYTDQCGQTSGQRSRDSAQSGKRNAAASKPARKAPVAGSNNTSLREELRAALNERPAQDWKNSVAAAEKRVGEALLDPTAPDARQRYDAAMKEVRAAYDRAFETAPASELKELASTQKRAEAYFAQLATQAGLGVRDPAVPPLAPASPDAASVAQPAMQDNAVTLQADSRRPPNIAAVGDLIYVCDGPIASANNVSCREMSASGTQCVGVTLADGVVGWHDSIDVKCSSEDLAQRDAYVQANPNAVQKRNVFGMDSAQTAAAVERMLADPRVESAVAAMPAECRDDMRRFLLLTAHNDGSEQYARWALNDYARLHDSPVCHDALAAIASALEVGMPARVVDDDVKRDWLAALDESSKMRYSVARMAQPMQAVANNQNTGGGSGFSLDDAINVLNVGAALLGAARSAIPTPSIPTFRTPSVPAVRTPTPSAAAAYPTSRMPTARPMNCTMGADNWLKCN